MNQITTNQLIQFGTGRLIVAVGKRTDTGSPCLMVKDSGKTEAVGKVAKNLGGECLFAFEFLNVESAIVVRDRLNAVIELFEGKEGA